MTNFYYDGGVMEKITFKRRLLDFFERHDPANKSLVEPIAEKFPGKEEEVFNTLNKFYMDKPNGIEREAVEKELDLKSNIMGPNAGEAANPEF